MLRRTPRPRIRTQIELQRHWQRLTPRFGERAWGLRYLFLAPDGTATRAARLTDVCGPLDLEQQEGFARTVDYLLEDGRHLWRVALLITRPGPATVVDRDLEWAATLYDAARRARVAYEIVHLAAGGRVVPLPPDDMPHFAVGF